MGELLGLTPAGHPPPPHLTLLLAARSGCNRCYGKDRMHAWVGRMHAGTGSHRKSLTGHPCSAVLVMAGADSTRNLIQKLGR